MPTRSIIPRDDKEGKFGLPYRRWLEGHFYEMFSNNLKLALFPIVWNEESTEIEIIDPGDYELKTCSFVNQRDQNPWINAFNKILIEADGYVKYSWSSNINLTTIEIKADVNNITLPNKIKIGSSMAVSGVGDLILPYTFKHITEISTNQEIEVKLIASISNIPPGLEIFIYPNSLRIYGFNIEFPTV